MTCYCQVVRQDGRILVRLSPAEGKIESDTYAFKAPPPSSGGLAPPKQRSGEILRNARAGAAGLRRPIPASAAGDVARSMSGADGRAPWARSSPAPPPPPPTGFTFGARKAAATGAAPVAAARSTLAWSETGWSRRVVRSRVEVGRRSVRLTLEGNLPTSSTGAADWTCGAHAMVRLEGGEGGEQPYTPYQVSRSLVRARAYVSMVGWGPRRWGLGGGAWETLASRDVPLAKPPRGPSQPTLLRHAPQRTCASAAGTFELVVKAYPRGALSPRIAALQPGDALLLRGPISGAPRLRPAVGAIGFVAGGTGVTPMLQMIYSLARSTSSAPPLQPGATAQAVASCSAGGAAEGKGAAAAGAVGAPTSGADAGAGRGLSALPLLRLLCFNRQEEDILVADELAELSAAHPQLRVFHSLSDPPSTWSGGRGHPTKAMLRAQLPPPAPHVQLFWCGPPAFNSTVQQLLGELGYTDDMVHEFS